MGLRGAVHRAGACVAVPGKLTRPFKVVFDGLSRVHCPSPAGGSETSRHYCTLGSESVSCLIACQGAHILYRETLTHSALPSGARGQNSYTSLDQVRSLFRQAHGGRHRGKMVWEDMIAFYEGMEVTNQQPVLNHFARRVVP